MSETFKITFNRSDYPSQSLISVIDIHTPEAYSVTSLGIVYIAYCELKDSWLIERSGKSEQAHIDFIIAADGEFFIESNAGKMSVRAGDMAVVPSWIDRCLSIKHGFSKHLYIRTDIVEKYPQIDKIEIRKALYAEELVYYVRHIQQMHDSFSDSSEYRFHLFSMIQLLLRREIWNNENETFCKLDLLFRMLNSNSIRKYSIFLLAKKLGISVSSFYKICMKHYGKSPSRIIGEINMRKAADLLRHTELSLATISEQLGYTNQFAFSKAFRKNMDISPLQYRKKAR